MHVTHARKITHYGRGGSSVVGAGLGLGASPAGEGAGPGLGAAPAGDGAGPGLGASAAGSGPRLGKYGTKMTVKLKSEKLNTG